MYCICATCFNLTLRHHPALQIAQNITEIHNNCIIAIDISIYNILSRFITGKVYIKQQYKQQYRRGVDGGTAGDLLCCLLVCGVQRGRSV